MNSSLHILLVEDDDLCSHLMKSLLNRSEDLNASIHHVTTLRDAIAATHDRHFDVVILDLGLPDSEGVAAVSKLKSSGSESAIVVITGCEDEEVALEAIRLGAQEYLSKNHVIGQLLTRVIRHSIARQQQLVDAKTQALTDGLTNIPNRRAIELEVDRRFAELRRNDTRFCAAILDVDHFKAINDNFGHDIGDKVLRGVADTIKSAIREFDLVARYGGEEFVVLCPHSSLAEACAMAERVRSAIAASKWDHIDPTLSVTVSIGLSECSREDDRESLMRRADIALYEAKRRGRNQCISQLTIGPKQATRKPERVTESACAVH